MSPLMSVISRVSALVPVYDFLTAKEWAERLLYTQVVFCTFGALSWAFDGVVQVSFGFALLALVGFEIGSVKLLKMYSVSLVGMWFIDIIWLSLWAHRIDEGKDLVFYPTLAHATQGTQPLHNKYTTVPRFLLAMECLLFILRPVQILVWCKMWELDFGEVGGSDPYTNLGTATGAATRANSSSSAVPSAGPRSQFAGGGTHHVVMGGGGGGGGERGGGGAAAMEPGQPRDGYRPFIVPEAHQHRPPQSGDAYVPPLSPPPQNEFGEDV